MIRSGAFHTWLREAAHPIDGVLLDIDGVLLKSNRRLPGSARLLNHLADNSLPHLLVTNDGNRSVEDKAARLQAAGLPIDADRIVSCSHAIAPLVRNEELAGALFFVMGDLGSPCYAQAAGLEVTRDLERLDRCSGIIIGEDNYDWEPVINAAINYFIDQPTAWLIIPNPDEFYPDPVKTIHIAAGGVGRFIVRALEAYGTAVVPTYLGKPYPPIFRLAHDRLMRMAGHSIPAHRIVMVGDNLSADVAGGKTMGYRTALLLTGVTSETALGMAPGDQLPDVVCEGL